MGRRITQAGVAWLLGAVLLTGCGGDDSSETDPQPDPTTDAGAGAVSVSCSQYDPATLQCQVLEVVRSAPQGQVQLRTTIDLRPPTLDLDAVETTLDNPEDRARLLSDMQNPALNVEFDSQAQKALENTALLDDFERLAQLHPDRCQLVRIRSVSLPICT